MPSNNASNTATTHRKCMAKKYYKWKPNSSRTQTARFGSSTPGVSNVEKVVIIKLSIVTTPRSRQGIRKRIREPWECKWLMSWRLLRHRWTSNNRRVKSRARRWKRWRKTLRKWRKWWTNTIRIWRKRPKLRIRLDWTMKIMSLMAFWGLWNLTRRQRTSRNS